MKKSGDRVGRYLIEAPIGAGGMGEVYEAHDTRLGRSVALKLLRSDAGEIAIPRLLIEAQAAAAFEHPNAVVVFDAGEELGEMFIAMELVRGKPLRAFLGEPSIPIGRKIQWMIDAARAIGAAHRAGLIHRDVKPDNIVLRNDGIIKVLDFGIARWQSAFDHPQTGDSLGAVTARGVLTPAALTTDGALLGTPAYLSPEQLCREELDARTDQFAWAVTTYELLTGAPPWTSDDPVTLLSRILTSEPPSLRARFPEIPAAVEETIQRALSKHPRDRFPTIDDAAEALEAFAEPAAQRPRASRSGAPQPTETSQGEARTSWRAAASVDMSSDATLDNGAIAPAQRSAAPPRPQRARRWLAPGATLALGAVLVAGAALVVRPVLRRSETQSQGQETRIPAAAMTPLTVRTLACKTARVAGSDGSIELARAIGVGACVRLATDVGAEWDPRGPVAAQAAGTSPGESGLYELDVDAQIEADGATVTLVVNDRKGTARGKTPMDAIVGATAALAPRLAAPAMTPAEIASWGARDAAGARRISRVMHRMDLDLAPDDQAAARELLETDGDSPWTQYIAFTSNLGGAERAPEWKKGVLARTDKLPRARALLLQGMLMNAELELSELASSDRAKEMLQLLRQAYAEAPNDPEVAAAFAACTVMWAEEEAHAVLDKLYERSPAHSVFAIRSLLATTASKGLESERKNVERLHAALPESVAWDLSIHYAVRSGHLEAARNAVNLGLRLGMTGLSSGGYYAESGRIWLSLATLDPKGARELATKMLSVPRDFIVQAGADALIASYLLEGRLDNALSMERREVERQLANKRPGSAVSYASMELGQRLVLTQPLPDAERLRWLDTTASALGEPVTGATVRLLTGLARLEGASQGEGDLAKHRSAAEKALKDLEALAARESSKSRVERDGILVQTLAGVRKLRGNAEAARRWKETERAPLRWRRAFAVEAGLALAATGDQAGAEQAYKLAMDPEGIEYDALRTIIGRVKLAELYRAEKRATEAAPLEAEWSRIWVGADPGLRDRIEALR